MVRGDSVISGPSEGDKGCPVRGRAKGQERYKKQGSKEKEVRQEYSIKKKGNGFCGVAVIMVARRATGKKTSRLLILELKKGNKVKRALENGGGEGLHQFIDSRGRKGSPS